MQYTDKQLQDSLNLFWDAKFCFHVLKHGLSSKTADESGDQRLHLIYFCVAVIDLILSTYKDTEDVERAKNIAELSAAFEQVKPLVLDFVQKCYIKQTFNEITIGGYAFQPSPGAAPSVSATFSALLLYLMVLPGPESERLQKMRTICNKDEISSLIRLCQSRSAYSDSLCDTITDLFGYGDGAVANDIYEYYADARYMFSAAVIHKLLGLPSAADDPIHGGLDVGKAINWVLSQKQFDGGFRMNPLSPESHAGATFCSVGTLALLAPEIALQQEDTVIWLSSRLSGGGFSGRPNKSTCMCYHYWVGCPLGYYIQRLNLERADDPYLFEKVYIIGGIASSTDVQTGGVGQRPQFSPDPMHTFCGLYGLSAYFNNPALLAPVSPILGVRRALVDDLDV